MTSPYLAKCKRLRTDGPTPCLCCPRECVGDDPTIFMLPEVEAMLEREHARRSRHRLEVTIFGVRLAVWLPDYFYTGHATTISGIPYNAGWTQGLGLIVVEAMWRRG